MQTLHQRTLFFFHLYNDAPDIKPSCPEWVKERIIDTSKRAAMKIAVKKALDWKPIKNGTNNKKLMSLICPLVAQDTGYNSNQVRIIGSAIANHMLGFTNGISGELPPAPEVKPWELRYSEEIERLVAHRHYQNNYGWYLYEKWRVVPVLAAHEAKEVLNDLNKNPSATINGYLADSIRSWKQGKDGYEACSGCAYMVIFKHKPELWDFLMSRAPVGAKSENMEQVFPHEHERAAALRAAGWEETFRMSDSIFKRTNAPCAGA